MRNFVFFCGSLFFLSLLTGCEEPLVSIPLPENPISGASPRSLKPKAERILRLSLDDQSAYIRTHAIEVAMETNRRQLTPIILQKLKDSSVAVRFTAAIAIGDMNCVTCQSQIRNLLENDNLNIRMAAAYALVRLGNSEYHPWIKQELTNTDATVAANAALLLGKLGSREDLPALYALVSNDNAQDKVRFQAVESIARIGDAEIYRSKLWPMMISKYADDRVMGIRGMGALGTPEAKTALQTMLYDDVQEVRLTAAEQLGKLGSNSGKEEVAKFLQTSPNFNESTMATQMAVLAIGRIGGRELIQSLPATLKSESKLIRLAAAQSVLLLTK